MTLTVSPSGLITYVHTDALAPLVADAATVQITRASNVEPDPGGQWWANLAPVGGPSLGPFDLRRDALAAEVAWLDRRIDQLDRRIK